ncbi:hypothetical protein [Bradyrhizobium cosmicum]|uniref:hypothetical protein n=1 Tax=Bradyrhizobium cosmicum TaxID=1404864 RepID=UPI0028E4EF88|nr:hypothetical protein [Bradyrhizobium cosmicum]
MAQLIEFEGQQHEFPDDFTPADIQRALASVPPPAAAPPVAAPAPPAPGLGAQNAAQQGRLYVTPEPAPQPIDRPASILPSSVGGAVRDFTVGAQGVGKGLTDIVTGPFDLVAGAQNLVTGGINKLLGTNISPAIPASKLVEKATSVLPGVDPATMSRSEKLAYDVNRFGTQAIGTGAMLAQRAPQVAEAATRSDTMVGRVLDHLARPYTAAPARTLVGDTIGGMGSGVMVNAADNYVPEHAVVGDTWPKAIANALAPLVGAVGANSLQVTAEGLGGLIKNIATKSFGSASAPIPLNPNTKVPYSTADVDRAATKLQAAASGSPRALAQDIRVNATALSRPSEAGVEPLQNSAMPTSGLLSRDPGLITAEQGARLKSSPDFVKRDQNVKAAAAERVESTRDPQADLGAVMRRAAQAREARMGIAESDILQREEAARAVDQIRADQGEPFGPLANTEVKTNASRRLDEALVDQTYIPARAEKNRLFDTAAGRHEELPADEILVPSIVSAIKQMDWPQACSRKTLCGGSTPFGRRWSSIRRRAGSWSMLAAPARPTAAIWLICESSSVQLSNARRHPGILTWPTTCKHFDARSTARSKKRPAIRKQMPTIVNSQTASAPSAMTKWRDLPASSTVGARTSRGAEPCGNATECHRGSFPEQRRERGCIAARARRVAGGAGWVCCASRLSPCGLLQVGPQQ